ncbi:hypothetical protein PIIN_05369 [Serendipita indica DSM 11827]|uniref:Uncharacterized protein n=1 Tax=Serendipita indica (strain DSM 11827) TaxID=1109443 RepID=G4TJD7_SERID|nr:hypothetical protein PIIN_05369 [Serendipita indica DSM 11827]
MCYNVVDGRFHQACLHFVPMSTHFRDCLEPNCVFSSQHRHPPKCASNACIHHMTPSAKNPIRLSPSRCPQCATNAPFDPSRPQSPSSSNSSTR